jgi:5,10-methylene-tetrahydrofolate dehydrogenase/methenyl tetrahydrofolate cyclohydrolase
MALELLKSATVTICHSKTRDLPGQYAGGLWSPALRRR